MYINMQSYHSFFFGFLPGIQSPQSFRLNSDRALQGPFGGGAPNKIFFHFQGSNPKSETPHQCIITHVSYSHIIQSMFDQTYKINLFKVLFKRKNLVRSNLCLINKKVFLIELSILVFQYILHLLSCLCPIEKTQCRQTFSYHLT